MFRVEHFRIAITHTHIICIEFLSEQKEHYKNHCNQVEMRNGFIQTLKKMLEFTSHFGGIQNQTQTTNSPNQ